MDTGQILNRRMHQTIKGKEVGEGGSRGAKGHFLIPGDRRSLKKGAFKTLKSVVSTLFRRAFPEVTKGRGELRGRG